MHSRVQTDRHIVESVRFGNFNYLRSINGQMEASS